ncbi:MAG: ligase-associated DNA damage response endonuclease PdeM [Synechococcus sp.]|nr:ligase-associated DNA damage response endonuclease PdeM [Synechococcus sp.]
MTHLWHWQGQELCFLPERALWFPADRLLLVADLHLGKAEVFQAHGIPLPSDGDRATLNRLLALCARQKPSRLVVLGDLIHGRLGLTPSLREKLLVLPELCGCPVLLIGGNHDRASVIEGLPQQPSCRLGDLWLSHEPEQPPPTEAGHLLNVCGHVHPVASIQQGCDRLRIPCFAYNPDQQHLLIPAFGELTGGHSCDQRYRKWLVADHAIVPWIDPVPTPQHRRVAK